MKLVFTCSLILALTSSIAQAQSRIMCEPSSKDDKRITAIWPSPYLSEKGKLCFEVKSWTEYSGQNCVTHGGKISWKGLVIVSVDGESQGRNLRSFRVHKPVVNDELIEYTIESSRDKNWEPIQHVRINRLSGEAISYFIKLHGGEPYQCRLEKRKL
ncbi:hypothetical protein [Undibacterium flavidum]|uniref:Uncharacterized protein n=1 Tax=Undibacterium flavidum TaxID=2762297 RepID=A0ABR6YHD6_9BURK|nr:hypothetical protein [Undibacterium flavidum]MBC3875986.1 hypothetical protein [Undibacterium flavidum]